MADATLGPEHPTSMFARDNLAAVQEDLGRWAESECLRRDMLAHRRKVERPDSPELAAGLAELGNNVLEQAKWQEAEPLLRECLAIRAKAIPDDWRRYNTMGLLGGAPGRPGEIW